MSEQSLRDALEQKLATTDGWTVSNEFLLGLLAAHPVEPARPLLDREAVRASIANTQDRRGSFVRDFMDPEDIDRMADAVLALLNGAE